MPHWFIYTALLALHLADVKSVPSEEYYGDETTARSIRATTSPIPSTVFRRISVHDYENSTPAPTRMRRQNVHVIREEPYWESPLDLFKLVDYDLRRKNKEDVWNWDYWCHMQAKVGNCSQKLSKYYYDTQLDQCKSFLYSGCSGNKNNFDSLGDCEQHCKGSNLVPVQNNLTKMACELQSNTGVCLAWFPRFYYDVNLADCKMFTYSGCGGNENRFISRVKCVQTCTSIAKLVASKYGV